MYNRAVTGYTIDPLLYGSSFGIPTTAWTGYTWQGPDLPLACNTHSWYKLASFEPYTPPYYDGFAGARISVELSGTDQDLEQIIKDLQFTYYRLPTFNANSGAACTGYPDNCDTGGKNYAWENAMHINSSINLGGTGSEAAPILFKGYSETDKLWHRQIVFSPKWECPILDFTDKQPSKPFYSEITGGVAQGMWHQYGVIPSTLTSSTEPLGKKGITLSLQKSAPAANGEHGDLAKLLGLTDALGEVSLGLMGEYSNPSKGKEKNTLAEAVVAIPFKYDKETKTTETYKILPQAVFGGIPIGLVPPGTDQLITGARNLFLDKNHQVIDYANLLPPTFQEYIEGSSYLKDILAQIDPAVYALLQKMLKYVIPPQLDFLHNPTIAPFVMYMWEFEVDLKVEDLQNIWQNIAPPLVQNDGNPSRAFMKVESEIIEHVMPTTPAQEAAGQYASAQIGNGPTHNFFYDQFNEETTRWAVFKVKKRARNNYNNIIGRVNGKPYMIREDFLDDTKANGPRDYPYSFNWPHDFYSLVELVKINTSTTFSKRVEDMRKD